MELLSLLKQYVTKPRTVGAILPSSKYLASRMIENINFNHSACKIYSRIWTRNRCVQ